MKKKVIGFVHTHWDREWYLPREGFRKYLLDMTEQLLDIFDNTAVKPHNQLEWISYYAGKIIDFLLVDLGNFSAPAMLASGELIEFSYLGRLLLVDVIARAVPFLLLGIWFYRKRELALAAKD